MIPHLGKDFIARKGAKAQRPDKEANSLDTSPSVFGMTHKAMSFAISILVVLVCVALVGVGVLLPLPAWSTSVDIGAEGPFIIEGETANLYGVIGFHNVETEDSHTYRWTKQRATLTMPAALRMQPRLFTLVARGCCADTTVAPVDVVLNNRHVVTLQAAPQWRNYQILMPPDLSHPDYSVMVDLRSPTWTDASGRAIGVAVDRLDIRQMAPHPRGDGISALVVLAGVLFLTLRQRSCTCNQYPSTSDQEGHKLGDSTRDTTSVFICVHLWLRNVVQPVLLMLCWLTITMFYEPQLLPQQASAIILVIGLLLLWLTLPHDSLPPYQATFQTVLYAIIALWLIFSPQILGYWLIDDAFISFRYADNLVKGLGLVFNPGEYVEGYTNFLWTMIVAASLAVRSDPVVVTTGITLALAYGMAALTILLSRRFVPAPWVWVAPVLLVLSNPFLIYTTRGSGMETALFATLTLAALLALLRHRWAWAGMLTALTMLTRPDGVLLAGSGTLYALWVGWQQERDTSSPLVRLQPALLYGGIVAAIYGPYFLWRWTYYGYLLPNTFYVKMVGTGTRLQRGTAYLWAFIRDNLLLVVGGLGMIAGVRLWWSNHRQHLAALVLPAGFTLLTTTYVVLVGGDWMPGARFFVVVMPLLALFSTMLIVWVAGLLPRPSEYLNRKEGKERKDRTIEHVDRDDVVGIDGIPGQRVILRSILATSLVLFISTLLIVRLPEETTDHQSEVWIQYYVVRRYREVGRWLAEHTPPDTLLATGVAGALPYYAERPMIDILGLTDEHISHMPPTSLGHERPGHDKTDTSYVMQRQPDIVPYKGSSLLREHPDFDTTYSSKSFDGPEGYGVKYYFLHGKIPEPDTYVYDR